MSILQRIKQQNKAFKESDIVEMHHDFMECYGWIPLNEFRNIPIPTLLGLNDFIQKRKKKEYQKYRAIMALAGVKNPK